MPGMEQDDPFNDFFEIVKVGRHWHWFPDVTIYYISQTKSKRVNLRFSARLECQLTERCSSNQQNSVLI